MGTMGDRARGERNGEKSDKWLDYEGWHWIEDADLAHGEYEAFDASQYEIEDGPYPGVSEIKIVIERPGMEGNIWKGVAVGVVVSIVGFWAPVIWWVFLR